MFHVIAATPRREKQNARADWVSTDWCQQIGAQTIEGVWDDSGLAWQLMVTGLCCHCMLGWMCHRHLFPLCVNKLDALSWMCPHVTALWCKGCVYYVPPLHHQNPPFAGVRRVYPWRKGGTPQRPAEPHPPYTKGRPSLHQRNPLSCV